MASTAFYKPGPVLTFMEEVMRFRNGIPESLQEFERKKFEKEIKGKLNFAERRSEISLVSQPFATKPFATTSVQPFPF